MVELRQNDQNRNFSRRSIVFKSVYHLFPARGNLADSSFKNAMYNAHYTPPTNITVQGIEQPLSGVYFNLSDVLDLLGKPMGILESSQSQNGPLFTQNTTFFACQFFSFPPLLPNTWPNERAS